MFNHHRESNDPLDTILYGFSSHLSRSSLIYVSDILIYWKLRQFKNIGLPFLASGLSKSGGFHEIQWISYEIHSKLLKSDDSREILHLLLLFHTVQWEVNKVFHCGFHEIHKISQDFMKSNRILLDYNADFNVDFIMDFNVDLMDLI